MRCCVSSCKNDSRHSSKSQGITFHVFPNDQTQRSAWLRALNKMSWEPRERSAVCSDHFLPVDLYVTRSGLRKVRVGAVPVVLEDTMKEDCKNDDTLKVCRICLAMNTKLYPIAKYQMKEAYEHLTGLLLNEEDKLPQSVCYECSQRLINCRKFRSKSLRAHFLMLEVIQKQNKLTSQTVKSINRENNRLTSDLVKKINDPDQYDLCTEYIENIDIDIKNETDTNEIFIDENDFTKNDDEFTKNDGVDNELTKNDTDDRDITNNDDNDFGNDIDVDNDADFVMSDKDYSTDDSLPLERRRTKKKSQEKKREEPRTKKVRKKRTKIKPVEPKIDRRRKPFLNNDLNETLFSITDLTFEEQVSEILKRQESANYRNAVYKCNACFKGFLDEAAYNTHVIRHTDQCGEYECEICKTHFKHPHALRKHITAHHTQRFSCNQCVYITTHRQTARLHERWHKGTKYQCPHCPDEFVKFTTYMGHIRIKHPSDFVCELCGYSFVSEKGIELHKKLKHRLDDTRIPADGPYCELCNVRFVSSDALKRHTQVSARHTNTDKEGKQANRTKPSRKPREKEKESSLDDGKDDDPSRRIYPSQNRKAEGPIPCEQCGLQLEDSRAYHGHFRRMHPDKNRTNYPSMKSPCMCEVCGRMFQSYALLKDHTWTHTGERPFKCESCGKAFRMKQRLVAHRRVHASTKATYVCNACGKHFSTHSNRQRHMFIHTGLKPFKCEMCGKSFKHASEKRAHITYVHLKKPWPKRARGKRRHDNRQGQMSLQQSLPPGASEMDIIQPTSIWPACDPKMQDMNSIMDDKPMYYNLKI